MADLWIIEKRRPDGTLDLSAPQPESFFGNDAVFGMSVTRMAEMIFRLNPNPEIALHGTNIPLWPKNVNEHFQARRKTW